jgi:glycosyltransferase involved in cell wall biosynthesis
MLDGEGADVISRANAGLVAPAGSGAALAETVLEMINMDQQDRLQMGRNGLELSEKDFNRDNRIDELSILLERLRLVKLNKP